MPRLPAPMLASPTALPPSAQEAGWAFELKWDGMRVLARTTPGGAAVLVSRSGRDVTVAFPELAGLGQRHPVPLLLDGEVVALDDAGRPDFGRLQPRMLTSRAADAARAARSTPAVLLLFDLLAEGEVDLTDHSWDRRRARLDALGLDDPAWRTTPWWPGTGHTATDLMAASLEQGLEGVVAKRRESPYRCGTRSPDWRKAKHARTQSVVVVGWRPGSAGVSDGPGSLLVAVGDDTGALVYAGRVGSGLTGADRIRLAALLAPLAADAPTVAVPVAVGRDARWVHPVLVAEVGLSEWTRAGTLRHPVWRGLRPDTELSEVRREP